MKKNILLIAITLMTMLLLCCTASTKDENLIQVMGTIEKPEITTYQYGTHTIGNYAIKSSEIDLDKFTRKKVIAKGTKVEGYPIEGGPELLEIVFLELNEK